MRISDWSSDVCSSDLPTGEGDGVSDVCGSQAAGVVRANHWGVSLVGTIWGVRSAGGGSQWSGSAGGCSPLRVSLTLQIVRASCRERVGQYVEISGDAGGLKKITRQTYISKPKN